MQFDRFKRALVHDGRCAPLTRSEFSIVDLLLVRPGVVRSLDALAYVASTNDATMSSATIYTHIKRIRRKMRAIGGGDNWIATRNGEGYSWACEREQAAGYGKQAKSRVS